MYLQTVEKFTNADITILCAAVADYKPESQSLEKIKRKDSDSLTLRLIPNKDIAASLGKMKTNKQLLVGFALETSDETENAINKLRKKNLDFIVLNSLQDKGAGFKTDTNKITIIDKNNIQTEFPLKSKKEVANDIIDYCINFL